MISESKQDFILFREHKKPDASILLEVQLNNPKKLNVLNLEMVLKFNEQIRFWEKREDLSALFIHSAGDKAFCAGGDVAEVYTNILESKKQGKDPALAVQSFFQTEYETNYRLYHFPKPVVLWGNGFVMGGGLGLFMSSSYSFLTENSLLSMPEISIGFFPDVGASYFLNQIEKGLGRYLALTACRLNTAEAHNLKLSPWVFLNQEKDNVFDFLFHASFKDKESFDRQLQKYYKEPEFLSGQSNWIKDFEQDILKALEYQDVKSFSKYLSLTKKEDKKWEQNRENFFKGSPNSLAVIFEQLKRAKGEKSLKALFEMETVLAMNIARNRDFPEGVRAMLIDKDKSPQWKPAHIEDLSLSEIKGYFEPLEHWSCKLKV